MKDLIRSSLVAVAIIACAAVASGMPFPVAENNKVFLQEKDRYIFQRAHNGLTIGQASRKKAVNGLNASLKSLPCHCT